MHSQIGKIPGLSITFADRTALFGTHLEETPCCCCCCTYVPFAKRTTTTMAPKKKKKETCWQNSEGRKLLLEDVRSGRIPNDMDPTAAFAMRPEFDVFPSAKKTSAQLFSARLSSARGIIQGKIDRSSRELALLQQDRAVHPPPATNHRGEPRWQDSIAQQLLKQDVGNKIHEQLSRKQFYLSRPEYQVYPMRIISGHVDQEVRLIRFLKQYVDRCGGF